MMQCVSAVHPRVGGEQTVERRAVSTSPGSSPRGRGTGHAEAQAAIAARFIPAWAGNRSGAAAIRRALAVHPRVGGEQLLDPVPVAELTGSSPRGRGTVALTPTNPSRARFIPAWAGNSVDCH